ncbi:MAG: hypothetical protein ACM3O6_13245 [Acidobacteriota bacterium]
MLDQLVTAKFLHLAVTVVFMGAVELGTLIGRRSIEKAHKPEDMGPLTASVLGLLALLLAFTLSHGLSRYETRRDLVLEEANAIGSTAHLAMMLPQQVQTPTLSLLRDYAAVRIGLGFPCDPAKLERDVAKSEDFLAELWRQAMAVSEPQSQPAHRFIKSLEELTRIQEGRRITLGYHVPDPALLMMFCVAIVAMGFTGYQAGLTNNPLRAANLIMAATVAIVIVLVVDLDQPARGFAA